MPRFPGTCRVRRGPTGRRREAGASKEPLRRNAALHPPWGAGGPMHTGDGERRERSFEGDGERREGSFEGDGERMERSVEGDGERRERSFEGDG